MAAINGPSPTKSNLLAGAHMRIRVRMPISKEIVHNESLILSLKPLCNLPGIAQSNGVRFVTFRDMNS